MAFSDARAKIERAKEHIKNLEWRIVRLEDSYSAVIEAHPELSYKVIKYDLTDTSAIQDISLIIGDVLHNLKCALDYGWVATLGKHAAHAINDKTQFPTHETRDALKNALTDSKKNLGADIIVLMLTKIQPYAGGNDALWSVKKLNILDKHRLLLPVIRYTSIVGLEMENHSGEPMTGSVPTTMQAPPWYIRVEDGWNVKDKGKPSVGILFDEGTPVDYLDVTSTLSHFVEVVLRVLETLEALVETI